MAMPISRRRSPSTTYLPTSARRRSTSGSDRSRILVDEFTPADSQSFFERVRPMPEMLCIPNQTCFWAGRLTPQIRAMADLQLFVGQTGKSAALNTQFQHSLGFLGRER